MRLVALVSLRSDAATESRAGFESAVAQLPGELPSLRRSQLGRHLPGSVGGGDYTWDAWVEGRDARAVLEAPALRPFLEGGVVERLDAVGFEPQESGIAEPTIGRCVKRTLLLRVLPDAPPRAVASFERDVRRMPEQIGSIRNWALSRTDPALVPTAWTHVWEQEFRDVSGLEVDYMTHPYHWGVVDAWFDPECPQCVVHPQLAHVYCEAPASVLGG
jgi:hypothetical protein